MNRVCKILPVSVFTISFFIYLLTLCPTVYVGDSGEIIAAAYHLGIAHPPGYPLFCMLGHLFTYMPIESIAYRINLVATFLGSLTVLMLFILLNKLVFLYGRILSTKVNSLLSDCAKKPPYLDAAMNLHQLNNKYFAEKIPRSLLWGSLFAFFSSLLFAFTRTFWSQNLIAKGGLYTLNAFFVVLLLYLCILYSSNVSFSLLALISIICGLSLANHHTMVPLTFIFLGYILWCTYESNRKKYLLYFLTFLALGTLVALGTYLYLPIRSAANPPIDWGHPANFYNFLNHIFRKQYITVNSGSHELLFKQILYYLKSLISQFTPYVTWLCIPGIILLFKQEKKIFLLTLLIFISTSLGFIWILNFPLTAFDTYISEVFFIPSYLIVSIWIFYGFLFLSPLFSFKPFTSFIFFTFITFFVLWSLISNYHENDRSKNYIAYDYGYNILKTPAKNSILFVSGDNASFITAYLTMVEHVRPDLEIYDDYGRVFKNIYGEDFLRMAAGVYEKRLSAVQRYIINTSPKPIYCLNGGNIHNMSDVKLIQEGILYRVNKTTGSADFKYLYRGIDDNSIYKDYWCKEIIANYYFCKGEKYFNENKFDLAKQYYQKAQEIGKDSPNILNLLGVAYSKFSIDDALKIYNKTPEGGSKSAEVLSNIGTAYHRLGKYDEAISSYNEALKVNPKYAMSYFNLGASYLAKGDFTKADENFLRAIELNPVYTEAYYGLGNSNFSRRNYLNAYKYYLKSVEINPSYAIGWNAVGASLISTGKISDAINAYLKAVELKPNYTEAIGNLLNAYLAKGDKVSAIQLLETAVKNNPQNPDFKNQLKKLK